MSCRTQVRSRFLWQPHGAWQQVPAVPLPRQHRPQHAVHRLSPADRRVSELHAQHGRASLRHLRSRLPRRRRRCQKLHQWVRSALTCLAQFRKSVTVWWVTLLKGLIANEKKLHPLCFCYPECNCSPCGTDSCDPHTGQCRCKSGVTGPRCDRCEVRALFHHSLYVVNIHIYFL